MLDVWPCFQCTYILPVQLCATVGRLIAVCSNACQAFGTQSDLCSTCTKRVASQQNGLLETGLTEKAWQMARVAVPASEQTTQLAGEAYCIANQNRQHTGQGGQYRKCCKVDWKKRLMQGVYGAGAHTDYGALTVLATDESPGLQINTGGKWQHVKPIPNTFIINLGDMLERSLPLGPAFVQPCICVLPPACVLVYMPAAPLLISSWCMLSTPGVHCDGKLGEV